MNSIIPAPIARQPWQMLLPLIALVCFGAAVLYSSAGGHFHPYSVPHLMRFAIFLAMASLMSLFGKDLVRFIAYPAYGLILALLFGVELLGFVGGGSQRWINLGPIVLQPSELMKPAIVLVLARFYADLPSGIIPTWRSIVPAGVLIGMPVLLVLAQPDLGTAVAISASGLVVMFLAGLPLRWFLMGGAAGAALAPLAYFFGLHDYQRKRVLIFLDPESDPLGSGYHITQSKIAIGSGGFWGKGFDQGSQSHLNYLPEPHTDFVFATMSEEWGFVGGIAVLLIFFLVLRWGWKVTLASQDRFARLLAGGMVMTMFIYVAINMMMVMGLAPVVGVPLPFMSYGGSSMMTNMICLGTLMMVNRWNSRSPRALFS
ncbi:MAG: rod shape-determining protein RodA [Tsuneonella sp.]